jgi:hypothetical protein
MSNNDDHEEGEYVEDNENLPYPDEPNIQLGLNGQPLESTEKESSIFMSNQKKIRIDSAYPINTELIKRFVSQIRNEDFKTSIEKLIDDASWRQILRIAKGRCQDRNSVTQSARLLELTSLENYIFKGKAEKVIFDPTIWNTQSICRLLLDCYPASLTAANVSDTFASRALALTPNFDLTNSLIEQEFVRQAENLMVDMGDMKIAPQQHSLIVTAWIRCGPKKCRHDGNYGT